jgi:hypothetical protein
MAIVKLADIPNAPDLASMSAARVNNVNIQNVDFSSQRRTIAAGYEQALENPKAAGAIGGAIAGVGEAAYKVAGSYAEKQQAVIEKQKKLDTDVAKIELQTKVDEFNGNFWQTADNANYQTYGNQYLERFDKDVTAWVQSQPQSVQQGIWLNYLDSRSKGFVGASNAAHQQDLTQKFTTTWDGIIQKANRWDSEGAYADAERAAQNGLFSTKQKEEMFAAIEATKADNYANLSIQQNPELAAEQFKKAVETGKKLPGMESLSDKEYSNKAKIAENVFKYQQADKGTAVYGLIDRKDIKTLAQLEKTQDYQELSPEWKAAAKSKLLNEVLADTPDGNRAVGDSFGMLAKFATGSKGDLNSDYEKMTRMAGSLPAADSEQFLKDAKEMYEERKRGKGSLPTEIAQRYETSVKLYDWYKAGVFGSPETKKAVEGLKQAESDWRTISGRNQGSVSAAQKEFLMQHHTDAAKAYLMMGPSKNLFFESVKESKGRPMGGLGSPQASDWQPNASDTRADGTQKGTGFLGVLRRPDGGVSTEISIGVNINGKEMDIPTLVPSLNKKEVDYLLSTPADQIMQADKALFQGIQQKAVDHAKSRIQKGESPFASENGKSQGKITKYGYEKPGDKDYDTNSARGIGAADNQLTPGESVALSPDLERSTGAKIGDKVVVTLANGEKMVKRFDDRTSKRLKGRVDIYSPDGNQPLDGLRVAKVEKFTEDGQG